MLNTLLISCILLFIFVLIIYLIRKTFLGIFITIAFIFGINFLFSYYDINLKEFTYLLNSYEKFSSAVDNIHYDKENKEYILNNDNFGIVLKKDKNNYIIKGEASNLNRENIKQLFTLLSISQSVIPLDSTTLNSINPENDVSLNDATNSIVTNSVNKIDSVITNPDNFLSKINELESGSIDKLSIGNLNFTIDNNKNLKLSMGDISKLKNNLSDY